MNFISLVLLISFVLLSRAASRTGPYYYSEDKKDAADPATRNYDSNGSGSSRTQISGEVVPAGGGGGGGGIWPAAGAGGIIRRGLGDCGDKGYNGGLCNMDSDCDTFMQCSTGTKCTTGCCYCN